MRRFITRRDALVWLGGLATVGCGSSGSAGTTPAPAPKPKADAGITPAPVATAPPVEDAGVDAAPEEPLPSTPEQLLAGIESIVVLMMENRSFDHFLGSLKNDASYAAAAQVEGLSGTESNPDPNGAPVSVFKMDNFTPADPPHEWDECHAQFNAGANDGFVKAHAGASQSDVMGFHDRSQIPFYYWLADHFTICDHWFASVMGPTWPNRFYLHACTSLGVKDNSPFLFGAPPTIWERLKDASKTFKNYSASIAAWYLGGFAGVVPSLNPVRSINEFFDDAQQGTLPNFSIIDPDFNAADDHPSHDIMKGQAFAASIYRAIAESPQWEKTLLVIIYDEHGGFYDHVAPPKTVDPINGFDQMGFRIPAFVIGGMVKKGHVEKTVFDHTSVAATVKARFGIASLGVRMAAANTLASCIDPTLVKKPAPPPPNMPVPKLSAKAALDKVGTSSQPQLEAMIANGTIPPQYVDHRPHAARMADWLMPAERLGAVKLR